MFTSVTLAPMISVFNTLVICLLFYCSYCIFVASLVQLTPQKFVHPPRFNYRFGDYCSVITVMSRLSESKSIRQLCSRTVDVSMKPNTTTTSVFLSYSPSKPKISLQHYCAPTLLLLINTYRTVFIQCLFTH
jgi:hypothetical protein